jgi:hypothetical protein
VKPNSECGCDRLKPPIVTGSIPMIPFAPLVMFTGRKRLFMKIRTISPKPRVTIAR